MFTLYTAALNTDPDSWPLEMKPQSCMWRIYIHCVEKSGSYIPYDHYNPNHYDGIEITPTTSATTPPKNIHICIGCTFGIAERKKCELDTMSHCPESTPVATVIEKLCVYSVGGSDIFLLEVFKLYVLVTIARIHPITN